ncbi:undecaprenyl-phosphate glucose phosphotransferase [Bosea sp. ANAM02]|uniref:undecaprenyl-phosphate glucose phosphotransferase n=1 Tax=Bosea sp. ANAM02 TaxID=2020412 RepID=UPI00140F23F2|nr:undecaprenyl-phosphate glucose phosphotransferase [Bosea sp. ANAM02]BCB21242.1 undecaprenyl-phosphate glucose phosphotransferase [Bosea sp. ANAM02]
MASDFVAAREASREGGIRFRYDLSGRFVALVDVAAIVGASLACGLVYDALGSGNSSVLAMSGAIGALFAALFVLLMQQRGFYRPTELLQPLRQISNALVIWLAVTGFLTLIGFALKTGHLISRATTISFVVIAFCVVVASRFYWQGFISRALAHGQFATRRVAIVSDCPATDLSWTIQRLAPFGFSVAANVQLPAGREASHGEVDTVLDQAIAALRGSQIQEIVVLLDSRRFDLVERVLARLRILPLPIKLMLDGRLGELVLRRVERFGSDIVTVEIHRAPMSEGERAAKRCVDIVIAVSGLLLLAPLLVMTAAIIRLSGPGPILFKQMRNGFNNQPFKILKFRSMRVLEDGAVVRQASRRDDRVTAVGRWLRRLSIDELPQLWNVLRGEMSIVGPRPHAMAHDEHYERLIGDYPYRQQVKPGLTGWAQVNGSRGETPTTESMAERVKLDLWYVENASVWLDIRIIVRTFGTICNIKHTY